MRTAIILFCASCLYSILRFVLWLIFAAPLWRRLTVLAVLALAASTCHAPKRMGKNAQ